MRAPRGDVFDVAALDNMTPDEFEALHEALTLYVSDEDGIPLGADDCDCPDLGHFEACPGYKPGPKLDAARDLLAQLDTLKASQP